MKIHKRTDEIVTYVMDIDIFKTMMEIPLDEQLYSISVKSNSVEMRTEKVFESGEE